MSNKYMRKCTSLAIREMQIETMLRFYLILGRMAINKNTKTINAGEDLEKKEHFYTAGGNKN